MTLKLCPYCDQPFEWDDNIIRVNEEIYHEGCVKLYPKGYVVFSPDDEYLGDTEDNEDVDSAYCVLGEGEFL